MQKIKKNDIVQITKGKDMRMSASVDVLSPVQVAA